MEGGSNSTCSRIMAFGDTTNGPFGPMMIIPHPPSSSSSNALFLPLTSPPPLTPSTHLLDHQTLNKSHSATASSSCMVFDTQMRMDTNPNGGGCYFMDNTTNVVTDTVPPCSIKSKIMSHPHYPRLLAAYVNCQKVGAPPEVVARLEEACATSAATVGMLPTAAGGLGEDPALDQFMEAYCEMLSKYEQELSKPLKEAMLFLQRVEYQFKALTVSSTNSVLEGMDRNELCEEDVDANINFIDPQAEDQELKGQLLRKYSGYLGSLKQEFMKKRKKGKLPKEARQQLLDWWSRHYKWPYPSESQKLALAESTGLDQKQINNWFINQRKRHWKPSEEMQLVVMNGAHSQYYMDNVLGNPFPMDISPQML